MSPPLLGASFQRWKSVFSDWVESTSGLGLVWAGQSENPPQRRKPYALLQLLNLSKVGEDEIQRGLSEPDGNGNQKLLHNLAGVRAGVLQVQVITNASGQLADTAWIWADELQSKLGSVAQMDLFNEAGISIKQVGILQDLSAIEQSQAVSRVLFTVNFEAAFYRKDPTGGQWIGRVIGSGDVEGNLDPELTFDVEAP